MIKTALIGLGKMGQNHLRILQMLKSVSLVHLFDANHDILKSHCDKLGIQPSVDIQSALNGVDAVVITSPTSTHADIIKIAVSSGIKNIFVEKPMTDTLHASEEIIKLIQSNQINLQVGFIERYNPAIVELKKILDKSEKVVCVDFCRTNKLSARILDVDVVTDLMIHDIDLSLYLNGPVTAIEAHGVVRNDMIEFAVAMLKHANGRFSRIQASRITEKKIRNIDATCTDMFVHCNLLQKELSIHKQSTTSQKDNDAYVITSMEETIEVKPQEALLTELQRFFDSIITNEVHEQPDESAAHDAMKVCDAIRKRVLS